MRVYEMFMGTLEVSKPWITAGLVGVTRFLERLWAIGEKTVIDTEPDRLSVTASSSEKETTETDLVKLLHKTIKKVSADTASLNFNTAISQMMIYSNELAKLETLPHPLWEPLVIMVSAYAPHLGEELWEKLGHKESVSKAIWPSYDEKLTVDSEATIVVQVNGKIRDKFTTAAGTPKEELEKKALEMPGVQKWLDGQTVVKVIAVPDKLVNIVVK
jgi:leucyl-tRNA synthetase